MNSLIFLKLGGSLITDKRRASTARVDVIRRSAREIVEARRQRPDLKLLLAHGSGSFGHVAAQEFGFGKGVQGYAETGAAAARLNRIVADICLEEGLPVMSLPPSASAICDDGRLIELAVRPIEIALDNDLVPLVYGDVAFDLTRGEAIVSTEIVFAYLARSLRPERIVLAGQVEGVFRADPLREPQAQLIPRITPATFPEIQALLGGSHGVDVTGGMLSKVALMIELVREMTSVQAHIISGESPGQLALALVHEDRERGTWIAGEDAGIMQGIG